MSGKGAQDDTPDSLDAYLDGQLTEPERRAFEQRLADDPELAAQLKLQRAIDDSIERTYAPAASPEPQDSVDRLRPVAQEVAQPAGNRMQLPRRWWAIEIPPVYAAAAIAAVLLAGVAVWSVWSDRDSRLDEITGSDAVGPPEVYSVGPQQTAYGFYRTHAQSGFRHAWGCPPDVLAEVSRDRFGAEARYALPSERAAESPPIEVVGAYYAHIFSKRTLGLFVRVADEAVVCVLIDRREEAKRASPHVRAIPPDAPFSLHRRTSGTLVFYELTPLDEPKALEWFNVSGGRR